MALQIVMLDIVHGNLCRQTNEGSDDFSLLSAMAPGCLTQALRGICYRKGVLVFCQPRSRERRGLNTISTVVESTPELTAWDACLFCGRICLVLRILMCCSNDQFITSQFPIYPFITCFATIMKLNLSIGGAGGTLQEESLPFWFLGVVSIFASAPLHYC